MLSSYSVRHACSNIFVIYETIKTLWVTQWSHSLLWHCGLHNVLINFYDIVGYTMVSFIFMILWVTQWSHLLHWHCMRLQWFLLFIRNCRWLQWSLNSFITLYTIIKSDGETRHNLSIPLDCFTPRKLMFSEHFCSLFRINTNSIKGYLYTLDFLSTIYTYIPERYFLFV